MYIASIEQIMLSCFSVLVDVRFVETFGVGALEVMISIDIIIVESTTRSACKHPKATHYFFSAMLLYYLGISSAMKLERRSLTRINFLYP